MMTPRKFGLLAREVCKQFPGADQVRQVWETFRRLDKSKQVAVVLLIYLLVRMSNAPRTSESLRPIGNKFLHLLDSGDATDRQYARQLRALDEVYRRSGPNSSEYQKIERWLDDYEKRAEKEGQFTIPKYSDSPIPEKYYQQLKRLEP